jgi:hypothetical protein
MDTTTADGPGPADEPAWRMAAVVAGGLLLGMAIVSVSVSASERAPVEPSVGYVALFGLRAMPAVFTWMGLRGRPALWLVAAVVTVPWALRSPIGWVVGLPCAALLLLAGLRTRPAGPPRLPPFVVGVLVVGVLVAAVAALSLTQDLAAWPDEATAESLIDVVTVPEALVSLALQAAALVLAWRIARPTPPSPPPAPAGAPAT